MLRMNRYWLCAVMAANVLFAVRAFGVVQYVENYGADGATCNVLTSPCRSISYAITVAAPGDVILVGPGRYGDNNGDCTLGGGNEEAGGTYMITVSKRLTITSRRGPAVTVLDAATCNGGGFLSIDAVGITAKGVILKGFTIIPGPSGSKGVKVDTTGDLATQPVVVVSNTFTDFLASSNTAIYLGGGDKHVLKANQIAGNYTTGVKVAAGDGHVIAANTFQSNGGGTAVDLSAGFTHVVSANQIFGYDYGVKVSAGIHHVVAANVARAIGNTGFYVVPGYPSPGAPPAVTFAANQAYGPTGTGFWINGSYHILKGNLAGGFSYSNGFEMDCSNSQVIANVAADNIAGFVFTGGPGNTMVGDSAVGNTRTGVMAVTAPGTVSVKSSNLFGNGRWGIFFPNCGTDNNTPGPLIATNNFWGAAIGPFYPGPGDQACDGLTTTTPFSAVRFP